MCQFRARYVGCQSKPMTIFTTGREPINTDNHVAFNRYVREWLLHMSMADLLQMDATSTLFNLPEGTLERTKKLAKAAGWIPAMAASHEHLVRAFKTSGPSGKLIINVGLSDSPVHVFFSLHC